MNLINNLEYAIVKTAEVVKTVLDLPTFWFKDITYGQLVMILIIICLLFKLFWEILR